MMEPEAKASNAFQPFIPDAETPPEFTLRAVILGALLGIIFGASSLYLFLKVGMTVSASVPIAVLSITVFRALSNVVRSRRATILENNIVQTAGSAGESLAFGVGVTMPALFLLGFEMDVTRVMTVAILGGMLGILMMIPLRRAFIVNQHGRLAYPEGTACAEVLKAGERSGNSARFVFIGFAVAFVHKLMSRGLKLWAEEPVQPLYATTAEGTKVGLKGAAISGELAPELLGVGYIIGPRIASIMMAGAVLSYFILGPTIATFGEKLTEAIPPAAEGSLIGNMGPGEIKGNYLRFIGAGAVAAGGIWGMFKALPMILASISAGLRDLRPSSSSTNRKLRTQRDMPFAFVIFGCLVLVAVLMVIPSLGLGLNVQGLLGAILILCFGFIFVTVSSRLTGEVGASSNPISGMTIATLLMTCLIFWILGRTGPSAMLTALTIAAVVCIASSNGGTTSQDLKTGHLVGATPSSQQWAILVGTVLSSTVIGLTLLALNIAQTHYTKQGLPTVTMQVPEDVPRERPGKPYASESGKLAMDNKLYRVVHVRRDDALNPNIEPGRYLVDDDGKAAYRTDLPIDRRLTTMDDGKEAPKAFAAPQPQLFASIIEGILGGKLEWGLIIIGALVALCAELAGVSSLPFAVGMYIPLAATTPIFAGGAVRWIVDRTMKKRTEEDADTSPGVLLSSGYIAGGTLCGLLITFLAFIPESFIEKLPNNLKVLEDEEGLGGKLWSMLDPGNTVQTSNAVAVIVFFFLALLLVRFGSMRSKS